MNRLFSKSHRNQSARSGVTLIEVLMALLVMSIGVSAVAVLFPISMLRSIEATKLTNGAITKLNLETLLDVRPELIFDPDGDGDFAEHFQLASQRNYVVDPVGYYTHLSDGTTAYAETFGNDGAAPAVALSGLPRFGGGIRTVDGSLVEVGSGLAAPYLGAARLAALNLANQGDGWETQAEAQGLIVLGTTPDGQVPLSTTDDLSAVPTSSQALAGLTLASGSLPTGYPDGYLIRDPEFYRLVVFSLNGEFSQSFPLLHLDTGSNTAYFTEDLDADGVLDAGEDFNMNGQLDQRSLPIEFNGVVGRVLLQSRKVNDFSWMLSVRRRGDGHARSVDVVVRFNDGVDLADERIFDATLLPGTRTVGIRSPSVGDEPSIRKGKFLFDATNCVWYRIQDVQQRPSHLTTGTPWGSYEYVVTLEESIGSADGAGADAFDGELNGDDLTSFGQVMFPKSIVDVYPMGSRSVPQDLLNLDF